MGEKPKGVVGRLTIGTLYALAIGSTLLTLIFRFPALYLKYIEIRTRLRSNRVELARRWGADVALVAMHDEPIGFLAWFWRAAINLWRTR